MMLTKRRDPMPLLSSRIREARKAKGFSLRALGEAIGVSHVAIWQIEHAKNEPMAGTLTRLCVALDVSADYLLGLE